MCPTSQLHLLYDSSDTSYHGFDFAYVISVIHFIPLFQIKENNLAYAQNLLNFVTFKVL